MYNNIEVDGVHRDIQMVYNIWTRMINGLIPLFMIISESKHYLGCHKIIYRYYHGYPSDCPYTTTAVYPEKISKGTGEKVIKNKEE